MKKLLKLSRNENGQVLVLAALFMTVLMGFAAFAVDIGMVSVTKSKLQNAADAAALAGAASLNDEEDEAEDYAELNGIDVTNPEKFDVGVTSISAGDTETTTEKAYDDDDIEQKKKDLENELEKMEDSELIELAKVHSVTDGLSTINEKYTADDFKHTSDQSLIDLAVENSLTSLLTTTKRTKTDEEMEVTTWKILKAQLDAYTDEEVLAYDYNNDKVVINLNSHVQNGKFKDGKREDGIKLILKAKYPNEEIDVYDIPKHGRDDLVNAIVLKLNEETVSKTIIDDKGVLIDKLLEKYEEIWENETVTKVGKVSGNSKRVTVTLKEDVPYTFARVLGFKKATVRVRATAENSAWAGEDALPFINMDGDGENSAKGQPLEAWNKTGPGDKERINNNDLVISSDNIKVNYEDGSITFTDGKVLGKVQEPLKKIVEVGKIVYLFSIKESEMDNYAKGGSKELKNDPSRNKIPLDDIVLLKCEVIDEWDGTGSDVIKLKFLESYSWDGFAFKSSIGKKPDSTIKLVE